MKRYVLIIGAMLFGFAVKAQSVTYTCRYWFDQNHEQAVTTTFNDSIWQAELDVGTLTDGLHTLYIHVMDTSMKWSAPKDYLFFKVDETLPENYLYHCWFDQDFDNQQSGAIGDGSFLLDMADIEEGLHTVNVIVEGHALTSTKCYLFFKMPVEDPNIEQQYVCWFDDDYSTMQTGLLGSGSFLLDVDGLSGGLHVVNIQLKKGMYTSPKSYFFFKIEGIEKWEYCINGDWENRITTEVEITDTLDVVGLLPVETQPIRSTCFLFHPNGDTPEIFAKNEITFRFWDSGKRFKDQSKFYVDENVVEAIQADLLERNSTETISAPRNNQISWFNMPAIIGDSLAFYCDKACTLQLFAPSGEEVYNVSGVESVTLGGIHAWENGMYYLAVHDMMGSGETLSVTYQHLDKYAVLAYTPDEVGNTLGIFTIEMFGNGFDKMKSVILSNSSNEWMMDTILANKTNVAAVRFVIDEATINGNYNLQLCYEDQEGVLDTLTLANAIMVTDAAFGTIDIEYSYHFTTIEPHLISINIRNNGNVAYQGIPICIAYTNADNVWLELYNDVLTIQDDYLENGGQIIYHSNNILNKAIQGVIVPLIIPELGSFETKKIILNVHALLGTSFDFYVWGGKPWSIGTDEALWADALYCNAHPNSPGWNGSHIGGSGNNTGSNMNGSSGGTSGGATYTIGDRSDNSGSGSGGSGSGGSGSGGSGSGGSGSGGSGSGGSGGNGSGSGGSGNTAGAASDIHHNTCRAIPDPCALGGFIPEIGSFVECICGLFMTSAEALGHMLNAEYYTRSLRTMDNFGYNGDPDDLGLPRPYFGLRSPGSLARQALGHCTGLLPDQIQGLVNQGLLIWGLLDDDCPEPPGQRPFVPVPPKDPNMITGFIAESGSTFMPAELQKMPYSIEFENDSTMAGSAAHTIIVRDTLDATKFDLNSLAARSVTIGDKRLELNGEQTFARTLDLRPDIYVIAQVNQDYDPTTGIIQWTIQSLDPMTMEPTEDPNQGVLPVNYYGNGVGFIDYSVNLRESFADGTEISNRAGIIFDQEDQILTPTWTNIVDAVKPTSHIEEVSLMGDSLSFSFVSSDNRTGVWYHSLYYRNASTEQEWQVRKAQIFEDSFMLPFDSLQTTEYFVMAVDSAGNVEAMKTEAEVVVESSVSGFPLFVAGYGESTKAGWKFIASPVAGSIAATSVDNIFSATQYDLYYFDQGEESEWRNYKSNSFNLTNGKGYLYATKEDKTLIFRGAYNEADAYEVPLVYTGVNPHTDMRGWNLIGNPFTVPAYVDRSYYTMNEEGTAIEPVAVSEGNSIPACHGVMVKAETSDETVTFSRTVPQNAPNQGNIQIAVTQATTRGNTTHDKAIVSFNSSDQLVKFNFNESNAKVYIPQDGKDYAIAYATKTGEIPVNFKAAKSGSYTVNVNADGIEFNYLHLIDNLIGADVDLLTESSYTFEAKTTDYASRFRLVFSVSGDADGVNAPFAFINNGNIIIIGAEAGAVLQIVDVLGRVLVCRDVSHASAISTSGMVQGVYLLRLINGDEIRTQKIVID